MSIKTGNIVVLLLLSGLLSVVEALAVTVNLPALNAVRTDSKNTATTFDISLLVNEQEVSAATTTDTLKIKVNIRPDSSDLNKMADLFTVSRVNGVFWMQDLNHQYVQWSGKISDLVPFMENVILSPSLDIEVFSGQFSVSGEYKIFTGYLPVNESSLVYTPVPGSYQIAAADQSVAAKEFFTSAIETPVVQTKCILCHVEGGLARDTALVFSKPGVASALNNYGVFKALFDSNPDATEYILSKVSGGNGHTGGVQLVAGGQQYSDMQQFLALLGSSEQSNGGGQSQALSFFSGVSSESRADTLRRAALILAGRLPTTAELSTVIAGDDTVLRQTVKGLMQGDGFHEFLVKGANDKLLTEGAIRSIETNMINFPTLRNLIYVTQRDQGVKQAINLIITVQSAARFAPGELVAHVVENDLAYSEILTADYMMMNPLLNQVLEGTAVFKDSNNQNEYQPGKIQGYYFSNQLTAINDPILGRFVTSRGTPVSPYPHSGVLSDFAFLARYPTTATNRNRARARWTMYHFLGIDIENSTNRPTDAAALADTNNPTMNNANCTVCHAVMDPVAGTFQNWSEDNLYRPNGTDALDRFYKSPQSGVPSLYKPGDIWYNDMRQPGLFTQLITEPHNTLYELAKLITAEEGFAYSAVKFWWPAIFGEAPLNLPAVPEDQGYDAKFAAYSAQSSSIQSLASQFASNYNLKDLLADMVMSPWFAAQVVDNDAFTQAHIEGDLGNEKLLTPEQLQRKTANLTGFNWNGRVTNGVSKTGLGTDYNLLYGGIDSVDITKRGTEITSLMSLVSTTHAIESACPIVLREFILPDGSRKLFNGISSTTTSSTSVKQKIAELFQTLHGSTYAVSASEVQTVYQLFVDVMAAQKTANSNSLTQCEYYRDVNFLSGLGYPGTSPVVSANGTYNLPPGANLFLAPFAADPLQTKQAWIAVIIYMMTHYDYLYE